MIALLPPYIGEEERQRVIAMLKSGELAEGLQTGHLAKRFAQICGTRYAIATSSGTAALHMALLANDIGPGDEVIITPFTHIAPVNSIIYTGATPVFVDIEEDTFNIDATKIEMAITTHTRAIMAVHLFGHMCDMDMLRTIAVRHSLAIIEDGCHALGAAYWSRPAGSFGTGAFNLSSIGNIKVAEGGIITTDDEEIAERCRLFRNSGIGRGHEQEVLGYDLHMKELCAAVGLAHTERLGEFIKQRQVNSAYLSAKLATVVTPVVKRACKHVWSYYTVRVDRGRDRNAVAQQLAAVGIGSGILYRIPAHHFRHVREIVGELTMPIAERLAQEVLSLPVCHHLTPSDLEAIVGEVNTL